MIINSFPKIVKDILRPLPKNDYPVLNSRLYVEPWLAYALDNSLTSMRDLFTRLNPEVLNVKKVVIKIAQNILKFGQPISKY
ncbi:hypothetical protein A9P98_08920 [Cylindrospermopsis raciborskii CS-505]|uniref:Uncharacterized protein n=1 Tax=Cylindrospermopsis raciborskii CS-505 TaxID=533240 RepID=A0A853MB03_9CYAN|nr:hypothetical protein A9P98_08920 [Cylindrospermopsis raciborskii CS-505]